MLIFKSLGVLLIISSATFLGIEKANKHKNRVKYLETMQICVNNIESEIQHTLTPFPLLFKKLSESTDGFISDIFYSAHKKMLEYKGEEIRVIWQKSVAENSDKLFDDDIELFNDFSECVAVCDTSGQTANIRLYSERIGVCLNNARAESETGKSLYKALGIYFGILLSILLI